MSVSIELAPIDFERKVTSWIQAYGPISVREMESWTQEIIAALEDLPYQTSVRGTANLTLDRLFAIRCVLQMRSGNFDIVYADLRGMWMRQLSPRMEISVHGRVPVENGFEFRFAGLEKNNCYVTGSITVRRKP